MDSTAKVQLEIIEQTHLLLTELDSPTGSVAAGASIFYSGRSPSLTETSIG
jgi:hypothetical protein